MILMYTFCTDCWLLAVLYFTWLAFDWNTPKKGKCLGQLLVFLPPGGMSVGRGTLGRCRNATWAGRHLPGGFTLAVSRLHCPNVLPACSFPTLCFVSWKVAGDRSGCETGPCGAISETTFPSR